MTPVSSRHRRFQKRVQVLLELGWKRSFTSQDRRFGNDVATAPSSVLGHYRQHCFREYSGKLPIIRPGIISKSLS